MSRLFSRQALLLTSIAAATLAPAMASAAPAKNVMLFIADGSSSGAWDLGSYYEYGLKDAQPYAGFDVKLGNTTLPAGDKTYDAAKAWDDTPMDGQDASGLGVANKFYANYFAGYHYNRQGYTDSAAAATALATGQKTYNGRVNYDIDGKPMGFVSQEMKAAGKAVGVVTSVPISHATPAGFSAQNISRNNYTQIARQVISEDMVDVMFGAGNPLYDDNGNLRPLDNPMYYYIGEDEWNLLNSAASPMTLIQNKADFEAIADGSLTPVGRVMGMPKVGSTLQQGRSGDVKAADGSTPTGLAYNDNVPTLGLMTKAALNLLDDDDDGLFMMVEGGAVDWAAHANQTDRIIEEMVDFNHAVQAGIDWVNENSSWDETLMIVLTDHGNSMPMAMDSDANAYSPVPNAGAGIVPNVRWHFDSHTTENTLMWAMGSGAELFGDHIIGNDTGLREILGFNNGDYVDNTSVTKVMLQAAETSPVPLPGAIWLFGAGFGALGVLRRKRKAG